MPRGLDLTTLANVSLFLSAGEERIHKQLTEALGGYESPAVQSLAREALVQVSKDLFSGQVEPLVLSVRAGVDSDQSIDAKRAESVMEELQDVIQLHNLRVRVLSMPGGASKNEAAEGYARALVRHQNKGLSGQENKILVRQFSLLKSDIEAQLLKAQGDVTRAANIEKRADSRAPEEGSLEHQIERDQASEATGANVQQRERVCAHVKKLAAAQGVLEIPAVSQ